MPSNFSSSSCRQRRAVNAKLRSRSPKPRPRVDLAFLTHYFFSIISSSTLFADLLRCCSSSYHNCPPFPPNPRQPLSPPTHYNNAVGQYSRAPRKITCPNGVPRARRPKDGLDWDLRAGSRRQNRLASDINDDRTASRRGRGEEEAGSGRRSVYLSERLASASFHGSLDTPSSFALEEPLPSPSPNARH